MGNSQTTIDSYSMMHQKEIEEDGNLTSTTFLVPSPFLENDDSPRVSKRKRKDNSSSSSASTTPRDKSFSKRNYSSNPITPRSPKTPKSPKIPKAKSESLSSRKRFATFSFSSSDSRKIFSNRSFNSLYRQTSSQNERNKDEIAESSPMSMHLESMMKKYLSEFNTEILFDTKQHTLDSREILTRINFKNNLIFIFSLEDRIFGFYHQDRVQCRNFNQTSTFDSKEMFMFSMLKGDHHPMIIKRSNETTKSFTIHSREGEMLFTCFGAFWMNLNNKIQFNICLKNNYIIDNNCANPFTGKFANGKVNCQRFVIVQCQ